MQNRLEHGNQVPLGDRFDAADHLPLRDGVDGIDMKDPWLSVPLPLMNTVHAEETWLIAWVRLTSFANRNLSRLGRLDLHSLSAIARRTPQIVEVRHRDVGQPAVTRIAKYLLRPPEETAHRGSGKIIMSGIGFRQQRHIRCRVEAGKPRSRGRRLAHHMAGSLPSRDQAVDLRPAQSRYLPDNTRSIKR